MSADDLAVLKHSEGRIVAVELSSGEQFFAEIIIVVDDGPTPDCFLLRCNREPDGAFTAARESGESVLLSDIARVARLPGVAYDDE